MPGPNDSAVPRLRAIGFWRSNEPYSVILFPHPKELVDRRWEVNERDAVASYLSRGVSLTGYFGYSYCRFSDGPPDWEMGTDDMTDGVWVWPQALPLYVSRYCVHLPEDFVAHALANADSPMPELDIPALRARGYTFRPWVRWARRRRSNKLLALLSLLLPFVP